MKNYTNIYKLNENISYKTLWDNGFRNNTYKCFVYKNIVQMIVKIDLEDLWWDYEIYSINSDSVYAAYYNRKYGGKNKVVEEIDDNLEKIMNEMAKAKILVHKGDKKYGKKNRKIS